MKIVLRLGGSVVASPINPTLMSKYADMMKTLRRRGHKAVVVVGGGELARNLIDVARDMGLKEKAQDEIAISASRIYAQLFLKKVGNAACDNVSVKIDEVVECVDKGKIAVMGGLKPGMTTDAVAALVAEAIGADMLLKATNQEGIFDKDPTKHADAIKLDSLRLKELSRVCTENKHKAGIHQIIDPEAIKILKRARVRIVVVNGFKPENVLMAMKGKNIGTLVY